MLLVAPLNVHTVIDHSVIIVEKMQDARRTCVQQQAPLAHKHRTQRNPSRSTPATRRPRERHQTAKFAFSMLTDDAADSAVNLIGAALSDQTKIYLSRVVPSSAAQQFRSFRQWYLRAHKFVRLQNRYRSENGALQNKRPAAHESTFRDETTPARRTNRVRTTTAIAVLFMQPTSAFNRHGQTCLQTNDNDGDGVQESP